MFFNLRGLQINKLCIFAIYKKTSFTNNVLKPLTSIRFIFALMVLLSHCGGINSYFNKHIFEEGFVGVSFFFVLSGFIISYRYREQLQENCISKRKFLIARIARIYPLHLVTLFLSILLHREILQHIIARLARFVPNLLLLQAFIPKESFYYSFNAPSWSLCCEMFFYTLFPFLVKWLNSPRKLLFALFIPITIILTGMQFTPEDQVIVNTIWYVNPFIRLTDFLMGMLLYEVYKKMKDISWKKTQATIYEALAILLFLLFYLLSDSVSIVHRASAYYWLPVSMVIFVFSLQKGLLSDLLSNRLLIYLGEISFGVYMFHYLVIQIYSRTVARIGIELNAFASFIIILSTTLLLSAFSFRYFEKAANRKVKQILGK